MTATSTKSALFWRVSALALMSAAGWSQTARAEDKAGEGPWTVEFDGTYEFNSVHSTQSFVPNFGIPDASIRPARHGYDVGGRLTYQTDGSPMSYGLAVHFGRTGQRTRSFNYSYYSKYTQNFSQTIGHSHNVSHAVVDFEVGKDVGVGLLGAGGVTTIGGGLRYGHFSANTRGSFSTSSKYTNRAGTFRFSRTTDAVGPRIFVRSTSTLPGQLGRNGISVGVGADGAVLFGRQRANDGADFTTGSYSNQFPTIRRSHTRTVPTLGAFAQVNWHATGSPLTLSVGYKVDDYIHAIDGGFGTAHSINFVEHGPFASMTWKLP
jgi:hypothetical protein